MKGKFWILLALLAIATVALAGCGGSTPDTVTVVETVVVEKEVVNEVEVEVTAAPESLPEFDPNKEATIIVPVNLGDYPQEELAAKFMEKYPNITVEFGTKWSASQDEAAFLALAASGETDDIIGGGDENPDMYGPRGIYLDMQPFMDQDPDLWQNTDKWMPWWDYTNPDGSLYSVTVGGNPMVVFYNRDLLDAAGLEYPPASYDDPAYADWTWDKYREYAEALTTDDVWGVGVENNILVYWPFIRSNGARIVNEELTDYLVDDPKVVETFDYLTSLVLDDLAPAPAGAQALGGIDGLFKEGKIGMWVSGGWNTGSYKELVEAGDLRIGVAALPYNTTSENIVLCPAVRQGISAFTEHPEVAYEWLKFFYFENDDLLYEWPEKSPWGNVWPRQGVWAEKLADNIVPNDDYGPESQKMATLMQEMCSAENIMSDPPWNGPFPETRDITLAELELVYSGEQSLEDAIANINEQADLVMLRWNR